MKTLTLNEERTILQILYDTENEYVGCGAARCVFKPSPALTEYLCTILPDVEYENCIIKVALGGGGFKQLQAECEAYNDYIELRPHLATIYAAGLYVELMESVDTEFFHSAYRTRLTYWDTMEKFFESRNILNMIEENIEGLADPIDIATEAYDLIIKLYDYFGETPDAGQIGFDWNTLTPKAYDYGLYDCLTITEQTSDLGDSNLEETDNDYFETLIDILDNLIQGVYTNDLKIVALDKIIDAETNFLGYSKYDDEGDYYEYSEESLYWDDEDEE